jgi:glutaconate CoA-transferase subunit A
MSDRGKPEFVSARELAARVTAGAILGVGGLHFNRLPIRLLQELVDQNLKELHFVGWNGGLALEMLLAAGAVKKLTFCFSSLDIFGMAPRFRTALEAGSLEVEELPALALLQSFHAAAQNLD